MKKIIMLSVSALALGATFAQNQNSILNSLDQNGLLKAKQNIGQNWSSFKPNEKLKARGFLNSINHRLQNFSGANFSGDFLSGKNLTGKDFRNFSGSKFDKKLFSGDKPFEKFQGPFDFSGQNFSGINLSGLNLGNFEKSFSGHLNMSGYDQYKSWLEKKENRPMGSGWVFSSTMTGDKDAKWINVPGEKKIDMSKIDWSTFSGEFPNLSQFYTK